MKKIIKKAVSKTLPGLTADRERLRHIEAQVNEIRERVDSFASHDTRLDRLRAAVTRPDVEPYQPLYGVAGIIDTPRRSSVDRCKTIEKALGDVAGLRMLDIGSSLGYVAYYMADRGAFVEGWEENVNNAEASRLVGEVNGIQVDIKTKELNAETVDSIKPGQFDVVFVLNVFHHITRFQGLEGSQKLAKELLERAPVLIVELAKKGEDTSLPWDASQPENELDIVKGLDVNIKKLGEFGNHLSKNTRPLYMISRKQQIIVNNKPYNYTKTSQHAYEGSPVAEWGIHRRYYVGQDVFIKEYFFDAKSRKDNLAQIMNEISYLLLLKEHKIKIHHMPELIDFEIKKDSAVLVMSRLEGELAFDETAPKITVKKLAKDVLLSLTDLEANGLHHNDIRSWNVMVSDKGAWLIDYGLTSGIELEDNKIAFLWALQAILSKTREQGGYKKSTPPAKNLFVANGLESLYQVASRKNTTFAEMLDSLKASK